MESNNLNINDIKAALSAFSAKQPCETRKLNRKKLLKRVVGNLKDKEDYKLTEEIGNVLQHLLNYFSRHEDFANAALSDFKPSLKKGLYIYGNPGSGKTHLLEAFKKSFYGFNKVIGNDADDFRFMQYSWSLIVSDIKKEGIGLLNKYGKSQANGRDSSRPLSYFFDEWEPTFNLKDYGTPVDLNDIFKLRYELFYSKGVRTFITSNIFPHELPEILPHKIYSRFVEMFNFIPLGVGEDYIDHRLKS